MIVEKIKAFLDSNQTSINEVVLNGVGDLAKYNFRRQFMEEREDKAGVIRPSSIGRCARQQAYGYHGIEKNGKEIDWRARINFFLGDNIELAVVNLAVIAGCDLRNIGKDQLALQIKTGDHIRIGHPDGMIYEDGKPVALLSVKSMTDYAFKDFENGEIDPSYLAQENDYLSAEGMTVYKSCFVAVCKVSGAIAEHIITSDPAIVAKNQARAKAILGSTPGILPAREFSPDEKGFLPWNCLYCAWHNACWPKAEKVVVKGRYKLAIKE